MLKKVLFVVVILNDVIVGGVPHFVEARVRHSCEMIGLWLGHRPIILREWWT